MQYLSKLKITLNPNSSLFNFMSFLQNSMAHCPKCSKPLLNSGEFLGAAQFSMRCPWCQSAVLVEVQPKITASLKAVEASVTHNLSNPNHSSQGEQDVGLTASDVLNQVSGRIEASPVLQPPNQQ